MEQTLIEALDIRNVFQIKKNDGRIDIYFTAEGFTYSLLMKKMEEKYEAWVVWHENRHECPVCNVLANLDTTMSCRMLHKHRQALFHRLIEFPNIRLEWLYLPHAVQAQKEG